MAARRLRAIPALLLLSLPLRAHAAIVENTTLTTEDGASLATVIYRPDNSPRPVLVSRAGGATSSPGIQQAGNAAISAGYVFVYQQIRGFSPSTGSTFLYSLTNAEPLHEGDDGRSLLGFIAQQPWSNGHVAMQGWSHSGIVADLAAPGASPPLTGLYEGYATDDVRHQGLYQGGVIRMDIAAVLLPVGQPLNPLPSWESWAAQGSYIDDDAQIAAIEAVGIHRGGWFDAFGQGTLDTFSRIQTAGGMGARGAQKLIMGPWTHGGGASTTVGQLTFPNSDAAHSPSGALEQAWQLGSFTGDWSQWTSDTLHAVNVYEMGDPSYALAGCRWLTFDAWPPPSAAPAAFYFSDNRTLSNAEGAAGAASFVSDPSNPCPTAGGTNNLSTTNPGGPYDQSSIESRSDVVVFTSPVQTLAMEIIGRISADVWISTDAPDVDVVVRMTDVYPNGSSMLMAQGIQRARYRDGLCPSLLTTNTPTLVRVDMLSTALAIAPGHALRVIVSASASPLYAVNPQNGDSLVGGNPSQKATLNVLFGGSTPSALFVPVLNSKFPVVDAGTPDADGSTCADASVGNDASKDGAGLKEAGGGDAGSSEAGSVGTGGGPEGSSGATGARDASGGCSCNTPATTTHTPYGAVLVLLAARWRRRGRRLPRTSPPPPGSGW